MNDQTDLSDVEKLWSELVNDELDASQRVKLLNQVTSDLKAEVTQRPDMTALLEKLQRVFEERPLTENMWPVVERALLLAYGPAASRIITWLIVDDSIENRLGEILPMLDAGSEALLRNILTRHAEDLVWSYFAWNVSADEWRTMDFLTRQSLDGANYFTLVNFEKVNGERFDFQVRANQLLILSRGFVKALNDHPPTAFTAPDLVEYFLEQARLIVGNLSALTAAPLENPPSDATDERPPGETPGSSVNGGIGS